MKYHQRRAIETYSDEIFTNVAEVAPFIIYLARKNVLSSGEKQMIDGEKLEEDKLYRLLNIIKTKDDAWTEVISYFNSNQLRDLATKLQNDAEETAIDSDSFIADARVKAIRKYTEELASCLQPSVGVFVSYLFLRKALDRNEMKIISKENYSFDKTIHVLNFIRTKEFGWDCLIDFLKNNEYNNLVLKLETFAAQVDRDRISKLSDVSLTHLDVDYESSVNTERDSLTDELERSDKEQETSPHPTTNDRTQRVIDMVSAESAPHSQKSHPDFDAFGLFYAVGMIISGFVDLIEEGSFLTFITCLIFGLILIFGTRQTQPNNHYIMIFASGVLALFMGYKFSISRLLLPGGIAFISLLMLIRHILATYNR